MQKIESKFHFSNTYVDQNQTDQKATVVLEINYTAKNYSVTPYCGTINSGFTFKQSSHKWRMWKALTKSINEAIDFANDELDIN
jgi:hypothetical protein